VEMEIATVEELKRDFNNGHLVDWEIEERDKTWVIIFKDRDDKKYKLVDDKNQETREFESRDGVISVIEEVGFEVAINQKTQINDLNAI
jgi:hypothetical protein